jgi:magnesium transporter
VDDNVKFIVIKTPAENNPFNDSDAYYITIPICIILTHNQVVTVNSFDNGAIKKFLSSFQRRHPDKRNMMVLKIFEKIVQNFMEYLKEINQQRNFSKKIIRIKPQRRIAEPDAHTKKPGIFCNGTQE